VTFTVFRCMLVTGYIQLAGSAAPSYPDAVRGITLDRRCSKLHFLHGCIAAGQRGATVATYTLRFADGSSAVLPVVNGRHLRDCGRKTRRRNSPPSRRFRLERDQFSRREIKRAHSGFPGFVGKPSSRQDHYGHRFPARAVGRTCSILHRHHRRRRFGLRFPRRASCWG